MRHMPFWIDCIAMKAAAYMIMNSPLNHPIKHVGDRLQNFAIAGPLGVIQQEQKKRLPWKLRGDAIAAVKTIGFCKDALSGVFNDVGCDLARSSFLGQKTCGNCRDLRSFAAHSGWVLVPSRL